MKLAFFSPFPPKQTGIAGYSQALVGALRKKIIVTPFDYNNSTYTAVDSEAVDFATNPETILQLDKFDAAIFSLGNNPYYHLEILQAFFRTRGLLLLHDTVLYYLFAGLPSGAFYKHFCLNYGLERSNEINEIVADSANGNILHYQQPERYSFLRSPLRHAEAVIVHSHFAANLVRTIEPEAKVHIIPLLALSPGSSPLRSKRADELKRSLALRPGQILIGTFGFLGAAKRLTTICSALKKLQHQLDLHFVIVGDGADPLPEFATAGLEKRVTWLRYVTDEDFDAWIEATDYVLNLRYPSMGESSATLTRAMGMGKVCVVTDHATFSEYPDESVWKIPYDNREIDALVDAINILARNLEKRSQIASAAQSYIENTRAPDQVATRLIDIIAENNRTKKIQACIAASQPTAPASANVRQYFADLIHSVLPAHLQPNGETSKHRLPRPASLGVTAEETQWAIRVLLSREAHPELEIPLLLKTNHSLKQLTRMILDSEEFRSKNSSP